MHAKDLDKGRVLSPNSLKLKEKYKVKKLSDNPLEIDTKCISCSNVQSDIVKQFKIACLAYTPGSVVYRNTEFNREQLMVFRKFLIGQCSKVVHYKEPFVKFRMSTKSMFDDMYLYMREINQKYIKNKGIDPQNGMPI